MMGQLRIRSLSTPTGNKLGSLRRWAIRTLELGLDQTLAAQQMGHSREIHDKIYHRWIDQSVHQRAFEFLEASKEINGKNRKKQG